MSSILVVADEWDPHADKVCSLLVRAGSVVHRLDLNAEALRRVTFAMTDSAGWIQLPTGRLTFADVAAVWSRRTTVALSLQEEHQEQSQGFHIWKNEWNRHLFWIYHELRSAYWLNPLLGGAIADNKRNQLRTAKQVGLTVPKTISSNDRESLLEFAGLYESTAIKFLSQSMIPSGESYLGLYVNRVDTGDLAQFGGPEEQPVVLQPYLEKQFEVRYTVVGDRHYVCRIDSQLSSLAAVDWRHYDLGNTPHVAIEPPSEVRSAVDRLMKTFGLDYGAIDFVVDKSGTWWFLEVNTNGQWLWIEELTGLDISSGIASLLAERSRGSI